MATRSRILVVTGTFRSSVTTNKLTPSLTSSIYLARLQNHTAPERPKFRCSVVLLKMSESATKEGWSAPISSSLLPSHSLFTCSQTCPGCVDFPAGQRSKCEINSLVPALRSSGYSHASVCTLTHTGAQVVCCSGLKHTHTHSVLNVMKHCSSSRGTRQALKTR